MYSFFYFPILILLKSTLIISVYNKFRERFLLYSLFCFNFIFVGYGLTGSIYLVTDETMSTQKYQIYLTLVITINVFFYKCWFAFESFLLIIGFLNLLLIWFCCLRFNVSFGILLRYWRCIFL